MARRFIETGLAPSGLPSHPQSVPTVGSMHPDKGQRSRNIGPTYYKGETVKFELDHPEPGHIRKLTVGLVMDDEAPLFEGYMLPTSGGSVTVSLSSVDTVALDAGLYLWDLFEMDSSGRDRVLVNCGSFQLKETVGGRTVADDPTESTPYGEDAIPTLLTLVTTCSPGDPVAGDTFGELESVDGLWMRAYSARATVDPAASGGPVSVSLVDDLDVEAIAPVTVADGETRSDLEDLSENPVKLVVGRTYSAKVTDGAGLAAGAVVCLEIEFAISTDQAGPVASPGRAAYGAGISPGYYSVITDGIGKAVAGDGDALKFFSPDGSVDISVIDEDPTHGDVVTLKAITSESSTSSPPAEVDFEAGDLVNLYDDGGTTKAQKADASVGLQAHGFVREDASAGDEAPVFRQGKLGGYSLLNPGEEYHLHIDGQISLNPPTTGLIQVVGVAISDTELEVRLDYPSGYRFDQASGSSSWAINHNLGRRPSVFVYSGSGEVKPDIDHTDEDSLILTFFSPTVGKAYLS